MLRGGPIFPVHWQTFHADSCLFFDRSPFCALFLFDNDAAVDFHRMEQCNTADACVATALQPLAHGCSVDATKAVTHRFYKPHMLFMCPSFVFLHVHVTLRASTCVRSRVMLDEEEHDTMTLPFRTRCVLVQILLCCQVSSFVFLLSS